MSTEVVRPYRGVSAEDRRADRRAKLKEACLEVVGDTGVTDVTVEAVCARAGLTKRYFYESFADRDAIFTEVMDDFFTELRDDMHAALLDSALDAQIRAGIAARMLIEFLEQDRRRARLYVEAPGQPALRARRDEAYRTYSRLLLDTMPPPSPGSDPEARALAALIVVAGTTEAAITWLQGNVSLDRDRLIREIARMIMMALDSDD